MKQDDRFSPAAILTSLGLLLLLLTIAGYVLHQNAVPEIKESMRLELFKSALQLAVIVIVGGGIALLYKWVEHSWEAAREQAELRRHYVSRLGDAYRAVKEARRLLRAGGIRPLPGSSPMILSAGQVARYDEQMVVINKEQLRLEALMIESRNFPPVAGSRLLTQEIRRMESYLGKIIDEYEDFRPRETLDLRQMRRVAEFTGESDAQRDRRLGTFQQNFVHPHYRAISLVADARPAAPDRRARRFLPLSGSSADPGTETPNASQ
jgi:hypothetical protein